MSFLSGRKAATITTKAVNSQSVKLSATGMHEVSIVSITKVSRTYLVRNR